MRHVSHESLDYLIRHADAMTALALGNATALASALGAYVQASGAVTVGAVTAASFLQELAVPPVARQEPAAPRAVRATRRMDTGEDSKQALEARVHAAGAEAANYRDITMRQKTIKVFFIAPKATYVAKEAEVRALEAQLAQLGV